MRTDTSQTREVILIPDSRHVIKIVDGLEYNFYFGDEAFSKCPGVAHKASKLAHMTSHPARIKIEGRVVWVAEIYFSEIVNKTNIFKRKAKPKSKATAKYNGQKLTKEMFEEDGLKSVQGGKT